MLVLATAPDALVSTTAELDVIDGALEGTALKYVGAGFKEDGVGAIEYEADDGEDDGHGEGEQDEPECDFEGP